jgi:hypothetical protein
MNYTKWPENLPLDSSIARTLKVFPIWDFWFENKPSGNPVLNHFARNNDRRSVWISIHLAT